MTVMAESRMSTSNHPTAELQRVPRRNSAARARTRAAAFLIAPALVVLFVITVVPIFYGFYLSLTDYNPVERQPPTFHGLEGYIRVLGMPAFWSSIGVTLTYAIG